MKIFHHSAGITTATSARRSVVTIGTFDGLHQGHLALLNRLVACARERGQQAVVVSLWPHPAVVLGRAQSVLKLGGLRESCRILEQIGVDVLHLLRFTRRLAAREAEDFLEDILCRSYRASAFMVGEDAAFGRNRRGTIGLQRAVCGERNITFEVLPFTRVAGHKVGSREIRTALIEGNLARANELLGRAYTVAGRVVHGDARGAGIGFPTANLHLPGVQTPARGVYAGWAETRGSRFPAVVNIGVRPTFGGVAQRVEAHLLDYGGESLYGQHVRLSFEKYLRSEKRFLTIDTLTQQIADDVRRARQELGL